MENITDSDKNLADAVALGVNAETLGRYSDAGKQFKVAYDGINQETGKKLHQGLKGISQSKVNPDYANQNINQQAGYSAEVLDTAKQNAENIKSGNSQRVFRTDDLGRVNDTRADQVTLDKFGNVIDGSEVQLKFLSDSDAFFTKISGKEYAGHYPDGKFSVPSDQYDAIKSSLKDKISKLENQDLTPEKQKQLEYLKKVDKNLKKSKVSKAEAIDARKNPEKVTAKEIGKTSHEAGIEAAKIGAAVGGGIALITNTVAVLNGEKKAEEAAADTAIATVRAGAVSYGTGVANTALASLLKNSSNELLRSLGKANAPAYIIQTAITTVKSMARLCKGEINANEFFLEIGKNGTSLMASAQGAVVGQMLLPIPVFGALVGGLVSALVCGVIYDYTIGMKALNEEIDAFNAQLGIEIAMLKEYQAKLMSLDIDRFKRETGTFGTAGDFLRKDYSDHDFNTMLKITYEYIGIPCPWGKGTLNDFMADKNRVLTFG
ncbi:hypothetical protein FACS1894188_00820 [Clostridia bacterium]|nr:hypothetical protein FACS1894188_00820 [Clostridia bacterium]